MPRSSDLPPGIYDARVRDLKLRLALRSRRYYLEITWDILAGPDCADRCAAHYPSGGRQVVDRLACTEAAAWQLVALAQAVRQDYVRVHVGRESFMGQTQARVEEYLQGRPPEDADPGRLQAETEDRRTRLSWKGDDPVTAHIWTEDGRVHIDIDGDGEEQRDG